MTLPPGILTIDAVAAQFRALGMAEGHTVMVHASMSKVKDWIVGDVTAVIDALDLVVGPNGTIAMPTHTANNSEPSAWMNPPVPESWWPIVREYTPAFDPEKSVTRRMGVLAETFRRYPGTRRSNHPHVSLAARGKHAAFLTGDHILTDGLGETSPYARLLELDAHVLLLGVDHGNNTVLHVAEHRAAWPSKRQHTVGAAVMVDGVRRWVTYDELQEESEDFDQIGTAYEASISYTPGKVGQAEARYLRLRPLVDFAVSWMNTNRT